MRLYLSKKEARLVRATLLLASAASTKEQRETIEKVIDRIDLCERLQDSERQSKKGDEYYVNR